MMLFALDASDTCGKEGHYVL